MRPKNLEDIHLPPSNHELKNAGFTLRERIELRVLDIAGIFVQENPAHGSMWPSQHQLNIKLGAPIVSEVIKDQED